MKQRGTLLVFKPKTPRDKIEDLIKIAKALDLLDESYYVDGEPRIEEFNPEWGGPVWYVP